METYNEFLVWIFTIISVHVQKRPKTGVFFFVHLINPLGTVGPLRGHGDCLAFQNTDSYMKLVFVKAFVRDRGVKNGGGGGLPLPCLRDLL